MGQKSRHDYRGCWHHIFNRGIAKRTVFECIEDVRYFLSRLAKAHRMGLLEVHAFCFMLTHFHLLVRSPAGEIGHAMRVVTNPFSRWFNRRRRRDGPLFRGRFRSRPVESERYWWTLVRYIDFNPVKAGIVDNPQDFPFGSARRYSQEGPRPRWMVRTAIEEAVASCIPGGKFGPGTHSRVFGLAPTDQEVELVERRLLVPGDVDDPLDDLFGASPTAIRDWQMRKCAMADGTRPGVPIVTPATIFDLVDRDAAATLEASAGERLLLATGLMRDACGLSLDEIAGRLGCSLSSAQRWSKRHAVQIAEGGAYAEAAAGILDRALRQDHAGVRVPQVWKE
ncbi:MAG: hypothetical protein ABFS86_18845 [Planctomycetota bacterium]